MAAVHPPLAAGKVVLVTGASAGIGRAPWRASSPGKATAGSP